jgi:hypothetical protein
VAGSLTNGANAASITLLQAPFDAANPAAAYLGDYTLAIQGGANPASSPGGYGIGEGVVNKFGAASVSGSLGDGTSYSQETALLVGGQWPFYASLYGGKGVILGWLTLNSGSIAGTLDWISPANPHASVYPGGFTNQPSVIGSKYVLTNGAAVLATANNTVTLSASPAAFPLTNSIAWSAKNVIKVEGGATNRLSLTVNRSNGAMSGAFLDPATRKTTTIHAVVIQNQSQALGWFLQTPQQTGSMQLQ